MAEQSELNRLFWQSRRGMLELDVLLVPFVKEVYPGLDEEDQRRYRKLLSCEDQDMFGWFMQREEPEDEDLRRMVRMILDRVSPSNPPFECHWRPSGLLLAFYLAVQACALTATLLSGAPPAVRLVCLLLCLTHAGSRCRATSCCPIRMPCAVCVMMGKAGISGASGTAGRLFSYCPTAWRCRWWWCCAFVCTGDALPAVSACLVMHCRTSSIAACGCV